MRTLHDVQRALERSPCEHSTATATALLKEACRILAAAADYDRLAPDDQRHVHTRLDAIFAAYDRATEKRSQSGREWLDDCKNRLAHL